LESDLSNLDRETLEDLITVAIKDAQNKARQLAQEKLASLGPLGGMLPNFPN